MKGKVAQCDSCSAPRRGKLQTSKEAITRPGFIHTQRCAAHKNLPKKTLQAEKKTGVGEKIQTEKAFTKGDTSYKKLVQITSVTFQLADYVSLSSFPHCTGPSLREGAWSLTSWPWQAIQPSWQLLSRPRPLGPTNRRRASPTSTNKAQVGLRPSLTCKPVQPSFKQAQNSGIILACKHIAKYPVVENPLDSISTFS